MEPRRVEGRDSDWGITIGWQQPDHAAREQASCERCGERIGYGLKPIRPSFGLVMDGASDEMLRCYMIARIAEESPRRMINELSESVEASGYDPQVIEHVRRLYGAGATALVAAHLCRARPRDRLAREPLLRWYDEWRRSLAQRMHQALELRNARRLEP